MSKVRIYESKEGLAEVLLTGIDSKSLLGLKALFKALGADVEIATIAGEDTMVEAPTTTEEIAVNNAVMEAMPVAPEIPVVSEPEDNADTDAITEDEAYSIMMQEMAEQLDAQMAEKAKAAVEESKAEEKVEAPTPQPVVEELTSTEPLEDVKLTNYDKSTKTILESLKKVESLLDMFGVKPKATRDVKALQGARIYTFSGEDAKLIMADETLSKALLRV